MRYQRCAKITFLIFLGLATFPILAQNSEMVLPGRDHVEAVFTKTGDRWAWSGYRDTQANRYWSIEGPRFSLQLGEEARANMCPPGFSVIEPAETANEQHVVFLEECATPPVTVKQVFRFCSDGRTLRITSSLRSRGDALTIRRVGLLDIQVPGQAFVRMGPEMVSSPIFGDRIFAGVEHPSAWCQVKDDSLDLAQNPYILVGTDWVELPGVVFGSSSEDDAAQYGDEALRRAFLRYLETVRVKPSDMHVHYNDWWTAPVPSSQQFVLENIAALKRGLYDTTGFFFDSYALDAGWSNTHSVWEMDENQFPKGFAPIQAALKEAGGRVGLWISPSSLYPFALDNNWLASAGYETIPNDKFGPTACLAKGGKYQQAFKAAVLKHARNADLAHMKFDGYIPACDVADHGHPVGPESWLPIAEGLLEVFDALRAEHPAMAMEPTCFGYQPSPWWLMHTPFIIGPFGDDCPFGRTPCPEYFETLTTARDIENLKGRDKFLMPSTALQCFDIIVQCPGTFQNHAVMAIGRGRWFISCYINPTYMDAAEWAFFAELMRWARPNREFLQEPQPIGGNPEKREAYGYQFMGTERQLYCLRNPWIAECLFTLPPLPKANALNQGWELRMLYPRRAVLGTADAGSAFASVRLGPYATLFLEAVRTEKTVSAAGPLPEPTVSWKSREGEAAVRKIQFEGNDAPFGPSWTSLDGDVKELLGFEAQGEITVENALSAEFCLLLEGAPELFAGRASLQIDGKDTPFTVSTSETGFGAAQLKRIDHWTWYTASLKPGKNDISIRVEIPAPDVKISAFVRGAVSAPSSVPPFDGGPTFPLFRAEEAPWSRELFQVANFEPDKTTVKKVARRIVKIDGVYLDTMPWSEASAGWGNVTRQQTVQNNPMILGNRIFMRGLGTHAASRITFELTENFETFAATIGKDSEVLAGSVVFVVEGDGKPLFRSGIMRSDTPPVEISVPITGIKKLSLVVEDGGDGFGADHADWCDARVLK